MDVHPPKNGIYRSWSIASCEPVKPLRPFLIGLFYGVIWGDRRFKTIKNILVFNLVVVGLCCSPPARWAYLDFNKGATLLLLLLLLVYLFASWSWLWASMDPSDIASSGCSWGIVSSRCSWGRLGPNPIASSGCWWACLREDRMPDRMSTYLSDRTLERMSDRASE